MRWRNSGSAASWWRCSHCDDVASPPPSPPEVCPTNHRSVRAMISSYVTTMLAVRPGHDKFNGLGCNAGGLDANCRFCGLVLAHILCPQPPAYTCVSVTLPTIGIRHVIHERPLPRKTRVFTAAGMLLHAYEANKPMPPQPSRHRRRRRRRVRRRRLRRPPHRLHRHHLHRHRYYHQRHLHATRSILNPSSVSQTRSLRSPSKVV